MNTQQKIAFFLKDLVKLSEQKIRGIIHLQGNWKAFKIIGLQISNFMKVCIASAEIQFLQFSETVERH